MAHSHTLRLIVHEGLLSQHSASARKIAGHFKHSQLAQSRSEDTLTEPTNRPHQDVQTRWNSSFFVIKAFFNRSKPSAPTLLTTACLQRCQPTSGHY